MIASSSLAASLFLLLSSSAAAQVVTFSTPTPPPPQPTPDFAEPIPGYAVPPTPKSPAHDVSHPIIVPTASFALSGPSPYLSSEGTPDIRHQLGIAMWAGAAVHPDPGTVSPWVAFGSEFNVRSWNEPVKRPSQWEYVPELRFGMSAREKGGSPYWVMLPIIETYAIAGYRLPDDRPGAVRVGVGVSAPMLIELSRIGVAVPSMLEVTTDFQRDGTRLVQFRAGWQF